MDPLRIALRVVLAYVFLLVLLRWAGKRTVHPLSPFDFVLALVIGDLIDDAIWQDVPFTQFVVASGTLVLTKLGLTARPGRSTPPSA